PAEVRTPNGLGERRMGIVRRVGIQVMMPMMSRPPQRSLLHRAATEPGEHKLKRATGLVRSMRKIAVIPRRDTEHSNEICEPAKRHAEPGRPSPKDADAGQVE